MSLTLRCCSSLRTNCLRQSDWFNPSLPPACPALHSTLTLLCNHLDLYLPSVPLSTHLAPIPSPFSLLISVPLCPALPSNMSLLHHLCSILLPSLSRYPPRPALLFTMVCHCTPFVMPFLPSDLPNLLSSTLPGPNPVLPFSQSSANPPTIC